MARRAKIAHLTMHGETLCGATLTGRKITKSFTGCVDCMDVAETLLNEANRLIRLKRPRLPILLDEIEPGTRVEAVETITVQKVRKKQRDVVSSTGHGYAEVEFDFYLPEGP